MKLAAAEVLPIGAIAAVPAAADGARNGQVHEGLQLLRGVKLG